MPRYIDADKVLETMRSNMDMQELYLPTHFIDLVIEDMPTADVQPVVHGQWIYSDIPIFGNPYGRYCCSLCGSAMDSGEDNYCPMCGARMDGDSE